METLKIQNFKFGLDARREALASMLGTLATCQNAHINPGGEIEKRLGFFADSTAFAATTFGLQDTDSGLVTFGSEAAPGSLPTDVTYQRLQHPTGWYMVAATPTACKMKAVVFSCNYLGKAFVVAKYDDDKVFCYYNGGLVKQSRNGLVLVDSGGVETVADLSVDLATMVDNLTGWDGVANVRPDEVTAKTGSTVIKSPVGVRFTPVVSNTTKMFAGFSNQNSSGVAGQSATVAFVLSGINGTVDVKADLTEDGGEEYSLTAGAIGFLNDLETTANLIAAAINATTYVHGYTSVVSDTTHITIYAPQEWGVYTGALTMVFTGDMGATNTGASGVLWITVPNTQVTVALYDLGEGWSGVLSAQLEVIASGVSGTVSYLWEYCDATGNVIPPPNGATTISNPFISNPVVTLNVSLPIFGGRVTQNTFFRCLTKDSVNTTGIVVIIGVTFIAAS